jgi:hypothetical protein
MSKIKHGRIERGWQAGHLTGGELVAIKEIASRDGEYKAVIARGADGQLRVSVYRHFYVAEIDECYWSQVAGPSFCDTFQTAETVAAEELQNASGEDRSI